MRRNWILIAPMHDTPGSIRRFLRRRHATALDFLTARSANCAQSGTPSASSPPPKQATRTCTPPTSASSTDAASGSRRCTRGVDLTPDNLDHDLITAMRRQ